jgi:O-antigen/teichoic acid export membrane protein
MAGTLVVMPLVLHAIGTQGFGVWAAAASFLWMTVVVDFGVGQVLLTNVAQNMARGDVEEVRRQIAAAVKLCVLLGAAGTVFAFAVIPAIASPEVADAYLIAAACVALNIPLNLAGSIWSGLQRFHVTSLWEAFQTIVTVGGLFALTRFTTDTRCYVAVTAGALLAANICSMVNLFGRFPELRPCFKSPSGDRLRALLQRGAPFLVLSLSAALAVNLDSVIALALLGPDDASRMAVALRACLTAHGLLWVVTQPLWPAFTDAAARGDYAWVRRHILAGAIVVGACAVGGSALLLAFGQPLLELWMGGGMKISQSVLLAMSAWILMLSMGRIGDVVLSALGAVWFQARAAVAYGALAFVLKFCLGPSLGVAGILFATALAYGFTYAPAYLWWVTRWVRAARPASKVASTQAVSGATP